MPETIDAERSASANPGVISLNIKSKSALHAVYMPYLKNGGIFVPTNKCYSIGDEVFLLLSLMDEPDKLAIAGAVAWLTPAGAQNGKTQGIGVHFRDDEAGQLAKKKILDMLGTYSASRPTHTI
ncbi:MAG: PilZ domain-containing protein [Zoogloeaceae bacterium]|jgi:type IV pilus assembly protein PilZ|nr:PilZ domain-containing protein [Zoogloeaceae bacterium]